MAYDPDLADRIRQSLSGRADSREVKMFGGLSFMINGKIAATANAHGQLMVRCDPDRATELLKRQGAHWPEMRGKPMSRGWIVIDASDLASEKAFRSWIQEALNYNKNATSK
ncbi:TfoX/Sxy family protein [Streptomyces sp. NPDC006477]|uniref:TfoX/Sxy family protein n=1 Tax=Streptomyces sp. NPDC006477 TaxID=3364747 RepID=UPI00369913DE